MTPKEKSDELYSKYLSELGYFGMMDVYFAQEKEAKQCALIAVDLRIDSHFAFSNIEYGDESLQYWQQVKAELEKK